MNREVEERIVAMYFDNKDFEKNAKSTIDTLGQLKESLNIDENAAKGFSIFEKIGKTLNFDKANQKLQTMRTKLDGMKGSLGKAFEVSQTSLHQAENAVYSFRNLISKVFGFDLASKIVGNVESAFRNLTIAPINAGWDQYQQKMDSVKTIMSSTGESIEAVDKQLQEMTAYANKTIYSLTDMTSNLGKFTNNGIELERATKAMEGIANATADAGQGAQQASMAMYNISQAMGVGKMTTIDWKSLENANIATQKLKTTFLEMAAASGKLKKEVKDVAGKKVTSYFLETDEEGKKLKQKIELTAANFREYLSKGWLDKETMLRTFEIYSGQGIDVDTLEAWGIADKEVQQQLLQLGADALESAQQVRTFTKMMDALKESVQSGWAESFELIFGNMEEGTNLWTTLNDEIDQILTNSTNSRNKILKDWREAREELGTEHVTKQYYDTDTQERDIEVKEQQIAELKAQLEADQNRLSQKDRQKAKSDINAYNQEIKQKEARIKKINDQLAKGDKTLTHGEKEKLQTEKEQIQKEIDEAKRKKTELSERLATDETEKLSKEERARIQREINEYQAEIDHLQEIVDEAKKNTYEADETIYGRSGREIAIDTLWKLISVFKEVGKAVSEAFNDVFGGLTGDKLFKLTQKIEEKVKSLSEWFGKLEDKDSRIGKIKKGLTGVFNVIKAGLSIVRRVWNVIKQLAAPVLDVLVDGFAKIGEFLEGFGDLSPLEMIDKIKEGVTKLWEKITGFFTKGAGEDESPFAKWAKNAWTGFKRIIKNWMTQLGFGDLLNRIKGAWAQIEAWFKDSGIGDFFTNIWGWLKSKFGIVVGFFTEPETNGATGFSNFITNIWTKIDEAWQSLTKWFEESGIKDFLGNVWEWIKEKFGIAISFFSEPDAEGKTGFVKFITGVWNDIKKAWDEIVKWFEESGIKDFLGNVWGWIKEKFKIAISFVSEPDAEGKTGFVKFITGIWADIEKAWEDIVNWFKTSGISEFLGSVWEWIKEKFDITISFFSEPDAEGQTGFVKFLTGVWNTISETWEKLVEWFNSSGIKEFLGDAWAWIKKKFNIVVGAFTIPDDNGVTKFQQFLTEAEKKISEAWEAVKNFFETSGIKEFFADIWGWIMNILGLSGEADGASKGASANGIHSLRERAAAITDGTKRLISDVGNGKASNGEVKDAEKSVSLFERIFDALTKFFDSVKEASQNVAGMPELIRFIKAIGDFLSSFIGLLSTILESLSHMLKGEGSFKEWGITAIVGVFAIVEQIFSYKNAANLSKISTTGATVSSKFLAIAGGIFLLASGVALLTTLDQDKMWAAVGAVAVLGVVLGSIITAFNTLQTTVNARTIPLTGGEQILNNLVTQVGKIGMIAAALALLPNIITTIGDVKKKLNGANIGEDILNTLLGVTALISGITLVLAISEKLSGGFGISPVATIKTMLAVIGALALVLAGMAGILALTNDLIGEEDDDNATATIKGINRAAGVIREIGGAIGGFIDALLHGGTEAQKAGAAEVAAEKLDEMAQVFDEEKVAGINRMLRMMESVASTASNTSIGALGSFGTFMSQFADGLYNIATKLSEVDGPLSEIADSSSDIYKRLYSFMNFGRMMGEMMSGFKGVDISAIVDKLEDFVTGQEAVESKWQPGTILIEGKASKLERWIDAMGRIMKRLGEEEWTKDSGIQFDGLNVATKLVQALQEGLNDPTLPKFDATPIVTSILDALKLEDKAIAEVVHNMVQNGMILSSTKGGEGGYSVDTSAGIELINNIIKNNGNLDNLIDANTLNEQLFGKDGESGILGSFTSLSGKIPSLESMFADKGWMNFTDEDGNTIDLLGTVQEHLTDLGTTLSTMDPLEIRITPVFDYSNLTPESIQEELKKRPIRMGFGTVNQTTTISFEGLRNELNMDEVIRELGKISSTTALWGLLQVGAINTLGGHVDGVSDTISRLKMFLDTGVLVGELTPMIDKELYNRYLVSGYTG